MLQLSIGAVMTKPVRTVSPTESARAVATTLTENPLGSLVVCETGQPVGIVTYSDITALVSEGHDLNSTTVEAFMSSPLVTVHEDDSIDEAAKSMCENQIKRLPVVDDGEGIVGIVTTTDLSHYVPHLARVKNKQEAPDIERTSHRPDIAYHKDEWDHEYLGTEASIDVGETATFSKTLSGEDVEAFAEASGDTNRLHLDEEYAAKTRFGTRIAHGTLVAGLISSALARLPGLTIYLAQETRYLGPVEIGDRATANCEVVENIGDNRYRLTTEVLDENDETVIDGEAVVISDEVPE
jgi:acyl dehydratase/CBS domain-containing protein